VNTASLDILTRLSEAKNLTEIKMAEREMLSDQTLSITELPITYLGLERLIQIEKLTAGLDQEYISKIPMFWQAVIQMSN
jgi:transcriptional regulator with XRE-family HTH domain